MQSTRYISKTVNLTPKQIEHVAKTRISYSVFIRDLLDKEMQEGDQT